MSHRLLSAAAAKLGTGASAAALSSTPLVTPGAPATPEAAAPTSPAAGEPVVDVVTVADAQAAIATARTDGAAAERARTAAVFASEAGAANREMAAFMLNANPNASAEAITAHLAAMPKAGGAAATTTAPAPPAAAPTPPAAPTPAAPAAITHDLNGTPKLAVPPAAHNGDGGDEVDAEGFWNTHINGANASVGKPFGADIAPGLPRTGN